MTPEELEAIRARAEALVQQCGVHDYGLAMDCTCPQGDPRPVISELLAAIERLQHELKPARDVLEAARAWRVQFYKTPQAPRMAALIAAVDAVPCCDMHNGHCEPPSELCCHWCTEAEHPVHRAGAPCVLDQAASAPSPSNTQEEKDA